MRTYSSADGVNCPCGDGSRPGHPSVWCTEGASRHHGEAKELGIDPTEPDDHRYFGQLEWRRRQLDLFKHHAPPTEQIQRISNVREGAMEFVKVIMRNVKPEAGHPWCHADYEHVIRLIHEAMMTANKSIVNENQ